MNAPAQLAKILENITEIRVTMASMEVDLKHHIKRSDAHEKKLDKQENIINKLWIGIALLAGAGASSVAPEIMKLIGSIL